MQSEILNLQAKAKRKREEMETEDFNALMRKMYNFVDEVKLNFSGLKLVVNKLKEQGGHGPTIQNLAPISNNQDTLINSKEKVITEQIMLKSYTQTIAENQIDPECIIKVKLTLVSPEARNVLMNRIKSDNLCEDAKILDVTVVASDFITIKVADLNDVK